MPRLQWSSRRLPRAQQDTRRVVGRPKPRSRFLMSERRPARSFSVEISWGWAPRTRCGSGSPVAQCVPGGHDYGPARRRPPRRALVVRLRAVVKGSRGALLPSRTGGAATRPVEAAAIPKHRSSLLTQAAGNGRASRRLRRMLRRVVTSGLWEARYVAELQRTGPASSRLDRTPVTTEPSPHRRCASGDPDHTLGSPPRAAGR